MYATLYYDITQFPFAVDTDYLLSSTVTEIAFSADMQTAYIMLTIIDDVISEGSEYFTLHINTTDEFVIFNVSTATITITDNSGTLLMHVYVATLQHPLCLIQAKLWVTIPIIQYIYIYVCGGPRWKTNIILLCISIALLHLKHCISELHVGLIHNS